jgi:hypothetical protein
LLEDAADMSVRCINRQGKGGTWCGMGEGDGRNQGGFCGGESVGGESGPLQRLRIAAEQVCKRLQGGGNPRQEPTVKVDHTEELLELFDGCWSRKFLDRCHMLRKGSDSCFRNHVTQEFHGCDSKCALSWINSQAVVL